MIKVNLDKPESNGPFLLYQVPDFEGAKAGTENKGFYLILQIDFRFVQIDDKINWYTGNVASGGQHLLFRMPAFPYAFWPWLQNSEEYWKVIQGQLPFPITKAMNDAHSPFDPTSENVESVEVMSRQWKYIMLDFSSVPGVGALSSKVLFDEAGDAEALEFDVLKVPVLDNEISRRVVHTEYFLGFKVVVLKKGRKVARSEKTRSKLANKFAAVNKPAPDTLDNF